MRARWMERDGRAFLCVDRPEGGETTPPGPDRLSVLPADLLETAVTGASLPSMAGTWTQEGGAFCFAPRFAFVAGAGYLVLLDGQPVASLWRAAPAGEPTTVVVALHPMGPVVPLNLLRLFLHFSAPMQEGLAGRFVRVLRAPAGTPIDGVFLDMTPELWNASRTRLTLLLDPARIKRGLVPHKEAGYPLVEGEEVMVTVDARWLDAAGRPLREGFSRRYQVGPSTRGHVQPEQWRLTVPAAGTCDTFTVRLDRPLDQALLSSCLTVREVGADGERVRVPGRGWPAPDGRAWLFTPSAPWAPTPHELRVDARLEDLAGNSLIRVFDRDLARREDDPVAAAAATLAFTVGADACEPAPFLARYEPPR